MYRQVKLRQKRRLSIITDILIFLLILIFILLMISIFDIDINIGSDEIEYEELALISNQNTSLYSVEEENMYYIDLIKEEYNITVNYGNSTKNTLQRVNANVQENELIVNNNLRILQDALKKYPKTLFNKISNHNYSINVFLVSNFNNDNLALASRNNLNEYKIYISNNSKFERSFHHELYHILEYFMKSENKDINEDWELLNPTNFIYTDSIENLTKEYVYFTSDDLETSYFVSKYSKVSPKEDRAELFSEIMVMNSKKEYLNEGENIFYKAEYIMEDIHKYITTNKLYIDQFLINK